MSPLSPIDSKDLENIFSNPKSFPQAVKTEELWDNEINGKAFLLLLGFNLTTNSADKCSASAEDPPFPQINIFFFDLIQEVKSLIIFSISFSRVCKKSKFCFRLIISFFKILFFKSNMCS